MGTRSVVAVPREGGGWRGRYVHWDGYPEGVGAALATIVGRDGLDKAARVLTEEHYGWSSVTGEASPELHIGQRDGRFAAVPGYGVAYTTAADVFGNPQSRADDWITSDDNPDDWWVEFAYVLHADHIEAFEAVDGGWKRLPAILVTARAERAAMDDGDLDETDPRLTFDPCPECGETGACAWDAEGRPLIHATPTLAAKTLRV